jgi:murein DD-endopeptidase MepM/ murein hydrolase activator NlpD
MKFQLDQIKDAFIFVTPNFSSGETVRYKLKLTKIFLWVFAYSIGIILLTTIILGVTPLKNLVYHFDNMELKAQAEKTTELERKIVFLTKELESISSTNKKLEYAFILATSDSLDTNAVPYDSLKYEPNKNLPYGGNLYFIFNEIWEKTFQEESNISKYFLEPSKGLIINYFNPEEGHFGIDYAVQTGSSIFAAQGGLILFSDFTIDDGHKIIIQHDNGFVTIYKHCSTLIRKERDIVVQGELIGLSGNSGKNTTGPHLHFEIWKDGKPKNPKELFIK